MCYEAGMSRAVWIAIGLVAAGLGACADCDDEVEAVDTFLEDPANRECQSDADCVVVGTGCHQYRLSHCAQSLLNRAVAESNKWQKLSSDIRECEGTCTTCGALLVPTCTEGFCGGP